MHWLTRISLGNRWITFIVVAIIAIGSIVATFRLKTEFMPDIELPYIAVVGINQGHSPEEMIEQISIPAEDEIEKVSGLKHIESFSSEDTSFIIANFEYGTDMEKAEQEIEQHLQDHDSLGPLLMSEKSYEQIQVVRLSMEMIPLVWVTVSGNDQLTSVDIRVLAEELAEEVSDVKGLLEDETPFMKRVDISGGKEDLLIIPNVEAMNALGISVSLLTYAIQGQNQYASPEDIGEIELVPASEISPGVFTPVVKMNDVAEVKTDIVPDSRSDGHPSVSIIWRKDPDANTVDVANAITAKVEEFETSHAAEGIHVDIVMDQSDIIEESIADLSRDALIGMVLAGIVVLLFLWAFRASMIIVVSIPISILIGFLLMYSMSITINVLTLGGIAIAVGRIVDNSIVSLENIYRHLQRGEKLREAAIEGVKEVAMPITSATVATAAIFVPLVLVGGLVGEMFRPFAMTVTFALVASLIIALMVVPPLASFLGTKKATFESSDNWYTRLYIRTLRWSLNHRAITLVLTLLIFIGSLFIIPILGTSFLPASGDKSMTVEIQTAYGNDWDIKETLEEVEEKINELDQEEGDINGYDSYMGNPMGGLGTQVGLATVIVELSGDADMDQQASRLSEMCESIREENVIDIKVSSGSMGAEMMASDRLEIKVIGDDGVGEELRQQVTDATEDLYAKIQQLEDTGDIESLECELIQDLTNLTAEGLPDPFALQWRWMRSGWPEYDDNGQLLYLVPGGEQMMIGGHGFDLVPAPTVILGNTTAADVSLARIVREVHHGEATERLETIKELRVALPTGETQKLGDVATVSWVPTDLRRAEGGYAGTILAKIIASDIGSVNREVEKLIDEMKLANGEFPEGIDDITTAGVAEQMQEGFSDMGIAILLAIIIVYVVLTVSFRSWLTPLLIMFTMPLASIGAVLALLVTGNSLGMSAMMGVLMLVGIVLTNAIVLLTFVEDRRKEGYSTYEALMDGGHMRLRPILMTALTTMVALVPLAMGFSEGAIIAAELGIVVIGGLFSSTLLTLIVVPVLYSLTERLRRPSPLHPDYDIEIE